MDASLMANEVFLDSSCDDSQLSAHNDEEEDEEKEEEGAPLSLISDAQDGPEQFNLYRYILFRAFL